MRATPEPTDIHHAWGGGARAWIWTAVLGVPIGVLAGVSSALFLKSLEWATETRLSHGWLLWLLPVAGLVIGLAYHLRGNGSHAGNNLILDEIHEPAAWIPRRMAVFVFVGTVVTHLFGGSAGREGTAIQMAGSLTDGMDRLLGITGTQRRVLLLAAIGGGFASVFGVPAAGIVFGLEVQSVGRQMRLRALAPTVIASVVGNRVVHLLGVEHGPYPTISVGPWSAALVAKVVVASLAFGITSVAFAEAIHRTKALAARLIAWPPLRPAIGGVAVIALTAAVGTRDYLGLSLPLMDAALAGAGVATAAFAFKLLFTGITLGSGFQGGEVTPLFVVGATLGATMGHALGAPEGLMAALGFVAVFAGATNTPLACTVMGIELFGWDPTVLFLLACTVSYLASGTGGIYTSQRHIRFGFAPQPTDLEPA